VDEEPFEDLASGARTDLQEPDPIAHGAHRLAEEGDEERPPVADRLDRGEGVVIAASRAAVVCRVAVKDLFHHPVAPYIAAGLSACSLGPWGSGELSFDRPRDRLHPPPASIRMQVERGRI